MAASASTIGRPVPARLGAERGGDDDNDPAADEDTPLRDASSAPKKGAAAAADPSRHALAGAPCARRCALCVSLALNVVLSVFVLVSFRHPEIYRRFWPAFESPAVTSPAAAELLNGAAPPIGAAAGTSGSRSGQELAAHAAAAPPPVPVEARPPVPSAALTPAPAAAAAAAPPVAPPAARPPATSAPPAAVAAAVAQVAPPAARPPATPAPAAPAPAASGELRQRAPGEQPLTYHSDWVEDVIAGRGPLGAEIAKCVSSTNRRRHPYRRLRPPPMPEASPPADSGRRPRLLDGMGWHMLADESYVAEDEGASVGNQMNQASLEECQAACKSTAGCASFAFCGLEKKDRSCFFKRRQFQGNEEAKPSSCTTFYWGPPPDASKRKKYEKEVPDEPPQWSLLKLPGQGEVVQAADLLTTWSCMPAFGSAYTKPWSTCRFRNLYFEGERKKLAGFFVVHTVKGSQATPPVQQLRDMWLNLNTAGSASPIAPNIAYREHASLQDFLSYLGRQAEGRVFDHPGLTLALSPEYHFNVGHGLFDGFYPGFVSLLQHGLAEAPFRVLVLRPWSVDVEHRVPGMYAHVEELFGSIGGLGTLRNGVVYSAGETSNHRFEELVMGVGLNAAKLDWNVNFTLGACRELDACRAFRSRVLRSQGLPLPPPAHRAPPFRVSVVKNKRFGNLERVVADLQGDARPGGALEGFEISFVAWTPGHQHSDVQTGNFTKHMEIIAATDVHVSGAGTGQMYQTFLPDGAVHVALGDSLPDMQGFMEEYMAEGAPYLRTVYYPRIQSVQQLAEYSRLKLMLLRAKEMLVGGLQGNVPLNMNLSPVGKVWKAYAYWALRDRVPGGVGGLANGPIANHELVSEMLIGNSFPEFFVYIGLDRYVTRRFNFHLDNHPETCLLDGLRASFDQAYPEFGAGGKDGWFGTGGRYFH